jgi:hypothetical protein
VTDPVPPPGSEPDVVDVDLDRVEPSRGLPTESKVFLGFAAFYVAIGIIYAITSDGEWAGVALLFFAGVFALVAGGWLVRGLGPVQHDVEEVEATLPPGEVGDPEGELYLPVTSVWPLGIGLGAALCLAGVAVGWPLLLPGIALLAHSVIGFASQSRHRDLG